ncbi:MAG: enolase [Nitrososphaeria archaeon]|nr:enolase [Nitrososphaeria archaeon]
MNFRIKNVKARQVLDGRGRPTIEADLITEDGVLGRASVPSGTSRGKYEAVEVRDGGSMYGGLSVLKAVQTVNSIIREKIVGIDVRKQNEIDKIMIEADGTDNKSRLGANSILAVSLASVKAAALSLNMSEYLYIANLIRRNNLKLPYIMLNLIWGGINYLGRNSFEDHMIVPVEKFTFPEALRASVEIYYKLGEIIEYKYGKIALAGGNYTPPIKSEEEAFQLIEKALEETGYKNDFKIAVDAAADQLYDKKKEKYIIFEKEFTSEELLQYYIKLVEKYNIISIEDPFHEDDFINFSEITKKLDIMIVGDDIFSTNIRRLKEGVEQKAANAILFKVNQVGTITEALETAEYATKNRYTIVASMRTGETEDTVQADIAVAIGAKYLKGSVSGGERTAKYNRLLRIYEELTS